MFNKKIIAIVLSLLLLGNITVFANETYTDVKEKDYFYIAVEVATYRGFINGMGNNEFSPYTNLTLGQALKLSACINADFYEKDISYDSATHWADSYYYYALENGIIKETDFAKSDLDKDITKDRLYYIFANTLPDSEYIVINEKETAPEKSMTDYLEKLFLAGIVVGNENGFELDKPISRAESAMVVSSLTTYTRRQFVE